LEIKEAPPEHTSLSDWFRLASGYFYHQGHSWAKKDSPNLVRVGIDDFAQKLLGEASEIHLPELGSQLEQGEKGIRLQFDTETPGWNISIDLLSPVSGEVVEINKEVLNSTSLINQSPYENGWLFKVKTNKMKNNFKNLLSGSLAKSWMEDTVKKIGASMSGDKGLVFQDGGQMISGFAKELAPDAWDLYARKFLLTDDLEE
jgi:glycine cleavage system H lipoate-binding protein